MVEREKHASDVNLNACNKLQRHYLISIKQWSAGHDRNDGVKVKIKI